MPNSMVGPRSSVERPRIAGVRFVDHRARSAPPPGMIARRRAGLVGVIVFVVLFSAGLAVIRALPTRYAASTVVSFMPRPGSGVAADTVQMAGQKYVVIATSPTTLQTAGNAVGMTADDLADATTAVLDAGTGNVEITVLWRDRQRAVNAANAVAGVLVQRSATDQLVQGEATSLAVGSRAQVKPARALMLVACGLAAALAAVLAWSVMRARPRWRLRRVRLIRPRRGATADY
jgi:capsular polysaccharide biosynthesis protein